jgi:uncharacterized NAD(P)/FAD-binding protein YdhS
LSYDLAVVGAGFSAIAVTINALRSLPSSCRIAVIGDDPAFGRGAAYRTEFYVHRLNVPAGRMSVFADRPDDFLEWLASKGRDLSANDFASRNDYGLYLRDRLAALLRDRGNCAKVDFIKAKATGCIEDYPVGIVFHLNNTDMLAAKNVVLCLGVGNARLPVAVEDLPKKIRNRLVENPWKLAWLQHVRQNDSVCVLGSGLTMIDQVLALRAQGHRGKIHVLSRRGLVPHSHLAHRSAPIEPNIAGGDRAVSLMLKELRRQARMGGADWRAVIDGLRPHTQSIWRDMNEDQRSRFLRHALPWWNVHRHRISPSVYDRFDELIKNGTVRVHAGFVKEFEAADDAVRVVYRKRASRQTATLEADWIVNSTGMERAGIEHSPLLKEMQREGFIQQDRLGLGIAVDEKSRVVDKTGTTDDRLYAVGALTAGQFWEITAVPDIRRQAAEVVAEIAAKYPH